MLGCTGLLQTAESGFESRGPFANFAFIDEVDDICIKLMNK